MSEMKIRYQHTGHFWLECLIRMSKNLTYRSIGLICVSLFLYQVYLFLQQYLENPTARRVAFKESFIILNIVAITGELNNFLIFIRTSEKLTSHASHCALLMEDIRMKVCRDLIMKELKISSAGNLWEISVMVGYNPTFLSNRYLKNLIGNPG